MDMRYVAWAGYQLAPAESISSVGHGSIEIEPGWQLISIPVHYGYWDSSAHEHVHDGTTIATIKNYVIDQIEDLYGSNKVEVCNTYLGDVQAFYSYVVGVTPEGSPHNFQLVNLDGSNEEVSGFWIKSLNTVSMTITWGE